MDVLRVTLAMGLLLGIVGFCPRPGFAQNDSRSMKVVQRLEHKAALNGIAWSPSGAKLATISDFGQTITIWDAKNWKREREITQYSEANVGNSIVFIQDNLILTSAGAKTQEEKTYSLNLWDANTGALIRRISGPPIPAGDRRSNQAGMFVLSKGGSLLAMSFRHFSNKLVIFNTNDWSIRTILSIPPSPSSTGNASAFAFSPSEAGIAIANGRHLQFVDLHDNSISFSVLAYEKFGLLAGPVIDDLKYSPDGTCLATAPNFFSSQDSGAIRIWNAADARLINKLMDTRSSIRMIDWSADSSLLATADEDNFGKIWAVDADKNNANLIFQFPVEIASAIKFAPNGTLAATSGKTLLILN